MATSSIRANIVIKDRTSVRKLARILEKSSHHKASKQSNHTGNTSVLRGKAITEFFESNE